jgi:SagB-type dehydrogenase family enzyme
VNKDTSFILDYHEKTKHSEISVMTSQHYLDWNNRPHPFKIYENLPTIPLPTDFSTPSLNAILAISRLFPRYKQSNKSDNFNTAPVAPHKSKDFENIKKLTLKDLAMILFFSGGITREIKHGNNTFYMRAASATGALYPIEMYIVCKDISPDLKAGIYHFCPAEFSLTQIRKGEYRSALSAAAADNQHILNSPLTIIFTSLAWRNAWKYQERSYRHWFWDSGVIMANLLAIISSMNITSKLSMGFIDDEVDRLLVLEKEKEASIAMVSLELESDTDFALEINGIKKEQNSYTHPLLKTNPPSKKEIQFPLIWKTHENSKLFSKNETKEWINSGISQIHNFLNLEEDPPQSHRDKVLKRQVLSNEYQISTIPSIGEIILRRGSTRKFTRSSISFTTLSSIIYNSTRCIPMDFKKDEETLVDIYLIANDVEGIDPGGYFYNRVNNTLDLIKDKASRNLSGYLCLGQPLFSDASVVLFLMSNLNKIIKTLGNRGYRAAQFEAGIITGKIYLSAYAYGTGASGSTFYDDAVTNFFSPHSENKNTMIAVGVGNPSYKARPGKILPVRLKREQLKR